MKNYRACRVRFWLSFGVSALLHVALAEDIFIPNGETHVLTDAENVPQNVISLGDGAVVSLGERTGSGVFRISCSIDVRENAVATLDATGLFGHSGVSMGSSAQNQFVRLRTLGEGGRLVVKGVDGMDFGRSSRTEQSINFPRFDADVQFVQADGSAYAAASGLRFVNNVLLARHPVSSPYQFADGVIVALTGSNPLGLAESLSPGNWDLYGPSYPQGAVPGSTVITIGQGRTFYVRGVVCSSLNSNWSRWAGTVPNDLTVDGTLRHEQADWVTYSGAVSGSGVIRADPLPGNYSDIRFTGDVDFDGEFRLDTIRTNIFAKGASVGTLVAAAGHTLVFSGRLDVATLSGDLVLTDASTGTLHIATFAAGARVSIPESVALVVDEALGDSVSVMLVGESGRYALSGPEAGNAVSFDVTYPAGSVRMVLGGRISLSRALPTTVEGVELAEGCLWTPTPAEESDWESKVSFWLDATAAESIVFASQYAKFRDSTKAGPTNFFRSGHLDGSPLVYTWGDRRGESVSPYFLRNQRVGQFVDDFVSYGMSMLPALSTGTVCESGLRYIDLATSMSTACVVTNNPAHTAMFETGLRAAYAIVVFGSQNGGGGALFGNPSGKFARDGFGNTAAKAQSYCIATNSFETFVNGTPVDPSTVGFDGGWQIISMCTDSEEVTGLGFPKEYTANRGYVNYAEVLFFSEELSERERLRVEKYLSDKWKIGISHAGPAPIAQQLTLSGAGGLTLSADTFVGGTFSGRVDLNGFDLILTGDANLRQATVTGTGNVIGTKYRQLPRPAAGFSGTMTPPPPGLIIMVR